MDTEWSSAGALTLALASRPEVRERWPQVAGILESLGHALADAGHAMEQLSGKGPLLNDQGFQAAFERRVLDSLALAASRPAHRATAGADQPAFGGAEAGPDETRAATA